MARSWSGFLPQNAVAKEEWVLLEESQARTIDTGYEITDAGVVRSLGTVDLLMERIQKEKQPE